MKNELKFFILTILFLLITISIAFSSDAVLKKGFLDLTSKKQEFVIELKGEWNFYWKKFVSPYDTISKPDIYIKVPKSWTKYSINNQPLPSFGYATYKSQIKVNKTNQIYGIKIKSASTAYKLYINNELVAQNGIVSKNKEQSKAENKAIIVPVYISKNDSIVNITIHVSNYAHSVSGLWMPIKFGTYQKLHKSWYNYNILYVFILGIIFIMALYHLGLFILRRKELSSLYFALFCIWMIFRTITTEDRIITYLFTDISWECISKIEFITAYTMPLLILLFFYCLFSKTIHKIILNIVIFISVIILSVIIFTPIVFYSKFLLYYNLYVATIGVYLLVINFKLIIKKKQGAIIAFLGLLSLFGSSVWDILVGLEIINGIFVAPIGLAMYIFAQSFVLARRFTSAFTSIETMSIELKEKNKQLFDYQHHLETLVEDRTSELNTQTEKLEETINHLEKQKDIAEEQRDKLEKKQLMLELAIDKIKEKNDALSVKNKEITDSINYAKRIQKALLIKKENTKLLLKEHFIFFKPRDIVSGDFYWITEKNNNIITIVADCTGHGVPGAFMSMLGIALLNEIVTKDGITKPSEILNTLRTLIINSLHQKETENKHVMDGMDASVCVFNKTTKRMEFSGANNTVYVVRSNTNHGIIGIDGITQNNYTLYELKGDKMPVGQFDQIKPFTSKSVLIQPNDRLFLFSDGYADQFGGPKPGGKKFMYKQFKKLLLSIQNQSFEKQKDVLSTTFDNWKGETFQVDDVLVLGVKF